MEQAVLAAGSRKKLVLVLNKIDLVPREVVEKWLVYLRNEFPTIAFKASTQVVSFFFDTFFLLLACRAGITCKLG